MTGDSTGSQGLPLSVRLGWGLGGVGTTIFLFSKSLVLRYMIDYLGVAAATAAFLFAISKVYDALTDPVMGIISDRTRSRWGRRRPYLLAGSVLCAVTFVLLFSVPVFDSPGVVIFYMGGLLILFATAYTLFNVAHLAMPVEMTSNHQERSQMFSYRAGAIGLGTILGGFLGPIIIEANGGGREGHAVMSWFLGSLIFVTMLACFWLTRNAPFRTPQTTHKYSFTEKLRSAAANRPFMFLLSAKMFVLMTSAMNTGTVAFFTSRVLQLSDRWLGLYFLCYGGALLLSQPVWLRIIKMIGKRKVYLITALIYAPISASWMLADSSEHAVFFFIRVVLIGAMTGAILLASQSMLPDVIEYDHRRTGLTREGLFAGFYTTVEKFASAIGVAITGSVLGAMGYIASTGGQAVVQPQSAITGIYWCFALIPAGFIAFSCVFMAMYDLTEDKLAATPSVAQ
ncbi:MAG: MFS transporter [Rhodospirillaceae bacterium]|jgi:glycoside/pentoside/hexuronide:cation symporter, GPH family|nr:MFS transporter [Rhodospirillaceae bacterium]